MVYAGKLGKQNVSLGVSGRLDGSRPRNLIMWDSETNSLWSQLKGEAVYGKSKGKQLAMLPAVFVGLGTWKQMHPKTLVLDMEPVRRKAWFYKTSDMKRGFVRGRRNTKLTIGVGVRDGQHALVISNARIQKSTVLNVTVGKKALAFVWIDKHDVPLVYDRTVDGEELVLAAIDGELVAGKQRFDPLFGIKSSGKGRGLTRYPYIPTYLSAWQRYYPKGKAIQ